MNIVHNYLREMGVPDAYYAKMLTVHPALAYGVAFAPDSAGSVLLQTA